MKLLTLSFRNLLLLSFFFPAFVALLGSIFWIKQTNQAIHTAEVSIEVVDLIRRLDSVSHEHAIERGLTAGYLGSNGKKGYTQVLAQREKSDLAEENLKTGLSNDSYLRLDRSKIKAITSGLEQQLALKNQERQKIDRLNGDTSFFFYSEINRQALLATELIINLVTNKELSDQLNTLLALTRLKERAGQSRGALNGIFSANKANGTRHAQTSIFIQDEKQLFELIEHIATEEILDTLNELGQQAHWQMIEEINSEFVNHTDYSRISGPSNWFELATKRISDLKTLSDELQHDVVETAASKAKQLKKTRFLVSLVFGSLSFVLATYLAILCGQILKRTRITKSMMQMAAEKQDYRQRIKDQVKDEIGSISRSFDYFLDEFSEVLRSAQKTTFTATAGATQLNSNVTSALELAKKQQTQTELIATAVTETAYTNKQISSNAALLTQKSTDVKNWAASSSNSISAGRKAMDALSQEIEQANVTVQKLVNSSQNMEGLLDTIQSIAEQTNLLALNAAIEAARAGEKGRGFAVVADEVRNLANRTHDSTEEIHQLLSNLSLDSNSALGKMSCSMEYAAKTKDIIHKNVEKLDQLRSLTEETDEIIIQVAASTEEQSLVS